MAVEAYEKLEHELQEFCGREHVVVCSSGTAALHLAMETIGLVGKFVAMPDFTMVACARAAVLAGATPVFIDCNASSGLSEAEHFNVLAHCNLVVHLYGRQVNMEKMHRHKGVLVIEDLAECHGIQPHRNTFAGCWSFYRNKVVHGEEGGCVAFRDAEAAKVARELRCIGMSDHSYMHRPRGHNYRMSNANAELIRKSLRCFPQEMANRRTIEAYYDARIPGVKRRQPRQCPWVYDVWSENLVHSRCRRAFQPMSAQPEFGGRPKWSAPLKLSRELVLLPLDVALEDACIRGL